MSDIHGVIICGQHAKVDTFLCRDLINYFAYFLILDSFPTAVYRWKLNWSVSINRTHN